jgi:hypothetical protein
MLVDERWHRTCLENEEYRSMSISRLTSVSSISFEYTIIHEDEAVDDDHDVDDDIEVESTSMVQVFATESYDAMLSRYIQCSCYSEGEHIHEMNLIDHFVENMSN